MPPIDPELRALIDSAIAQATAPLHAKIERLEKRVVELESENADLRARLGKDSSNSSKPPSSDNPFKRKPPKVKGERKAGGQPGHKGSTRAMLPPERVSETRELRPCSCEGCGRDLSKVEGSGKPYVRQVVEIPRIEPRVTEFRFQSVRCPGCYRLNEAPVPAEARTGTGPQLSALAALLVGKFRLSRDAVAELLGSLLDVPICAATVQACCERIGAAIADPVRELEAHLPNADSIHMDETSWKERGEMRWLWAAIADRFTCFAIHRRRGVDQINAWFPEGYSGRLHTDRWRPYEILGNDRRQLCWSHLLRDLQEVVDFGKTGGAEAERLLRGATRMFRSWHQFLAGTTSRASLKESTTRFRIALRRYCVRGTGENVDWKWRKLSTDLLRLWPSLFRFIDEDGFEPTNNTAERGLRSAVMWRKISYGTRTPAGSEFVSRILSVIATCRQQGRGLLEYLSASLLSHRNGLPPPSLLPT